MGAEHARPPGDARRGRHPAHARPRRPRRDPALRHARARGRPHGPRRLLRRDVGGDQHLPPRAAAPGRLRRAAGRPVLRLRARARALRPVLGRDPPHDAARRGERLPRGRRRDRGRRHGAADAARRAAAGDAGDAGADHLRDGQALAVLQAVGGVQAYRRAVPAPPLAGPVARFLLYERAYPDAVASSVDVAARRADAPPTTRRARRRRSCASAACSPTSSSARARRGRGRRPAWHAVARAARARAGRRRHHPALLRRRVAARARS